MSYNKKIVSAIQTAINDTNLKLQINDSNFSSTLKSLNIDSLTAMSIIIGTEKILNVRLPDNELITLKTVEDLIKSFSKQVDQKQ